MGVTAFAKGNRFVEEGKLEEAIASYQKSIEENPQFVYSYQNLAKVLEQVGRKNEAIAALRQAVAINPQTPLLLHKLGTMLNEQGQFQEAVDYFRRALDVKKDVCDFYLDLANALLKLGKWSEVEEYLNQAGMLNGKVRELQHAEINYYLAEAKSGQKQWSEAVELYQQSWDIDSTRVDCGIGLGKALGKLGRWSEAVELYRQMVVESRESGEVLCGLGQALGQLGRWEEAVAEYRQAIGLGFAGTEVRHYLGYALGQLGRWEEAVVEYRLVLEVNPKSAQVRHQLGYALMRLEYWREAEIELRKAVELHPKSAVVWQHLGDVLRELGKKDEAESAYNQSLELKSGKNGSGSDLSNSLSQTSLTREKIEKVEPKLDRNNQKRRNGIFRSENKKSTYLNVLFVLYGNIDSNGGYHAQLHAARLLGEGVDCIFAIPDSSNDEDILRQSLDKLSNPVSILPYSAFSIPGSRLPFANGGSPDIIHAWTPREVVRKFVEKLLPQCFCPLVIHLEDNEKYLTATKVGISFAELAKLPEAELDRIIPGDRYHPIKGKAFLSRAQGLTMIIETLKNFNIGNVPELVLSPPVDESLFYPQPINQDLRRSLDIPEGNVVLAYTGNVHSGNRDEVWELYKAVEILHQRGCPTVLLRTGLNGHKIGIESWERSYEKYLVWVERVQVPEVMAAADVLVQPGVPGVFNDKRIPSKLLEYFAMGRPVILPKSNLGLKVKHGQEGYVLARCDAQGIAGAVQKIKADGELARRLSDGAVDFYLSQLEQSFKGTKLNDFYGKLTGKVSSLRDGKRLGTTFFVVTPCLNAATTIDETIKSVISQSGDFWIRYHVQDGGSMDGTIERLRYWESVLSAGSSDVQCQGVKFSWVSEPDEGIYDGVMKGFDSLEIAPRELMTWINADDVLMPGALSVICRIVGEHPEVEWIGGPQYVFETDVRQKVLQRGTPTPTAVIREGLCDGKHWEMLQQEGTFFSKALWLKSKHGLKGFELAGDWNFWREMADHGVYYQYESPLGAFRKRVGQLSVDRIGDYRAEIERILPLEVRKGRFEGVYREQEWGANLIKSDGVSGKMVVEVQSVREVYEKVREKLSVQGDRFGEVESSKAQSDETKETNTSSLILTKAQHSLRIIIMTHISMGYGSPEYLRLYTLLKRRGHEVLLIDHEEPPGGKRKYVPFPGVNRIRVKHSKTMTQEERALYYKGFYDSLSEFKGQILISGWTDFALRKVGDCPIQVLYFNEIEDEFGIKHREELEKEKPTCADAVISANEDRLEIAKGIHHKAKDFFIVYNAPLVSEFNELPRKLNTTDRYNVLYQGQLNPIAGIDILLELAENYSNKIFLHIAGPASDKYEKLLMNLHNSGKLHYHGFVTHEKLAELRSFCDVGLVTWREDLGQLPLSIKYCSPTKLYEYIASGLPVVFLPNYTLNLWNDRFSFGRGASEFSSDSLAEAIFNCCKSEEIFHSQSKHNINMFKSVLNYEFLSSAFVNWLENYAEKNLDPNEAFSQK